MSAAGQTSAPAAPPRTAGHPFDPVIDEATSRSMAADYRSGWSLRALADAHNVALSTASYHVRKHLDVPDSRHPVERQSEVLRLRVDAVRAWAEDQQHQHGSPVAVAARVAAGREVLAILDGPAGEV